MPDSRRAVAAWVLYDLANTIFAMGIVTLYFSLWVREQVGADRADTTYGMVVAASMGVIFLLSPVLGAMSDRAPRRMPFLVGSTLLCVGCTALLGRVGLVASLALFLVANAAFQAGLQFYDALLVEVSTEENRGRISGIGVGVGYIGSYFAVGLGLWLGTDDKPLLFTLLAAGFLVLALPCFVFVRERGNPSPEPVFAPRAMLASARRTVQTLRDTKRHPGLARFLFGRLLYTDAINTVVATMVLFATNVAEAGGAPAAAAERHAQFVLMGAITCAVLGGFAWGQVVDRIGPRRTLDIVLGLWIVIFAAAAAIGLLALPFDTMWGLGALTGLALGGVWTADRPLMLRLTPPDRIGEFYGLYGMVGRFAAVVGPALWATMTGLAIHTLGFAPAEAQGIAILVPLVMVALSLLVIRRVDDRPRAWAAPATADASERANRGEGDPRSA